jgi:hypothetical protein
MKKKNMQKNNEITIPYYGDYVINESELDELANPSEEYSSGLFFTSFGIWIPSLINGMTSVINSGFQVWNSIAAGVFFITTIWSGIAYNDSRRKRKAIIKRVRSRVLYGEIKHTIQNYEVD